MEIDQRVQEVETRLLNLRDAVESGSSLIRLDEALVELIGCMQQIAAWAKESEIKALAERVRVRSG